MKIKILGTNGEIEESARWHTRHSGVPVSDDSHSKSEVAGHYHRKGRQKDFE